MTRPFGGPPRPLMILLIGPDGDDPYLSDVDARLFAAGHLPVTAALRRPAARRPTDSYLHRLLLRCDAVLAVGPVDEDTAEFLDRARWEGKAVFASADEVPPASSALPVAS